MGFLGLALLTVIASVHVSEPAPASDRTVASPNSALAALTEQIAPREMLLQVQLREFDRNFGHSMLLDEDIKALEEEFPGTVAAITAACRTVYTELTRNRIEAVHGKLSDFLAAGFNAEELRDLANFYGSSHGQNLVRVSAESVDQSASYRSISQTGSISEDVVETQRKEAIESTVRKLSQEETTALLAFAETPTFTKLRELRPAIRKMIQDTMGAADPDYEKQIEEATAKAVEAHLASFTANNSK